MSKRHSWEYQSSDTYHHRSACTRCGLEKTYDEHAKEVIWTLGNKEVARQRYKDERVPVPCNDG